MCRSIKTLREPYAEQVTEDDVRAAALQYVRKVSGLQKVPKDGEAAVAKAVAQIVKITSTLLESLPERGAPRTREGEKEKAKARWERREKSIKAS